MTLALLLLKPRIHFKWGFASLPPAYSFEQVRETIELVLGVAQAVVQLAGVIKRDVVAFIALHKEAYSIESKAIRSYAVVEELSNLTEVRAFDQFCLLIL